MQSQMSVACEPANGNRSCGRLSEVATTHQTGVFKALPRDRLPFAIIKPASLAELELLLLLPRDWACTTKSVDDVGTRADAAASTIRIGGACPATRCRRTSTPQLAGGSGSRAQDAGDDGCEQRGLGNPSQHGLYPFRDMNISKGLARQNTNLNRLYLLGIA